MTGEGIRIDAQIRAQADEDAGLVHVMVGPALSRRTHHHRIGADEATALANALTDAVDELERVRSEAS